MKSIKIQLFFAAVLGGILLLGRQGMAQHINGDGNMKTQQREVSDFHGISNSGPFDILLTQGGSPSLKVEADENILPYIITEVNGGTLVLKTKKGAQIRPSHKITISVTTKSIDEIKISGVGSLKGTNTLKTEHLDLGISGSANIDLSLQTGAFRADISGTAKAQLRGSATQTDFRISGTADIDALDMSSDDANIAVSGVGKVHINAQKKLDARISGVGKIWYKGNPAITQSVSGMGSIKQE